MVMNMCGRGDKDIFTVADILGSEAVSTRIDRRFAALKAGRPRRPRHLRDRGRSRLRDLAEDHQGPAQGRRRRDRARHALHRSDGRWPGDPGRRPARAGGGPDHEEDAEAGEGVPQGRPGYADRPDGLLQSDLCLWRRQVPCRCQGRRRRRLHHRRPAAGGRRRVLPAGAQGRHELHPPGDAHHRRHACAGRVPQHSAASSTTSRCSASPAPRRPTSRASRPMSTGCASTRDLPICVGFGVKTAEQARAIAKDADGVVVGSALVGAIADEPHKSRKAHLKDGEGRACAGGRASRAA